jgi:hypothetical protein
MSALELSSGMGMAGQAVVGLYAIAQAGLVLHAAHRGPMLVPRFDVPPPCEPWWAEGEAPRVLVQLPVRDEPAVVERLVAAAAALDWPRDRLEIQLLDDSGEAASALGAAAIARARAHGVHATHLRRGVAQGYKAGALAAGLARSRAEFVAVFDADFVPPPDFVRRLLPHFAPSDVGMVQARWGHLNRDASLLTRAQAVLLDAHQLLEHAWRQRTGRFFNFNGTAGVWRRACIDTAGGWQHDTLTEDLDLSYRAQLAGWRFVFDPTVVVPGELPGTMDALRSQQRRWARGALQTARKLAPAILRSRLPKRVKLEAILHLTANVNYPLLLLLALLLAPALACTAMPSAPGSRALSLLLVAVSALPVVAFLAEGLRRAGRRLPGAALDLVAALVLAGGLSWHLTRAVAEGLWGPTGTFVRTPKSGATGSSRREPREAWRGDSAGAIEMALAAGFTTAAAWTAASGHAGAVPFLGSLALGLAWVGLGALRPRGAARRAETLS